MRDLLIRIKESDCQKCPDLAQIRKQVVVYRGNVGADVAIIAQNPGQDEDVQGVPLVGKSGKILDALLRHLSFVPDIDFFFSNVVLCLTPNNDKPSINNIRNCSTNLMQLTERFKVIISLGKASYEGITFSYNKELYHESLPVKDIIKRNPIRLIDNKFLFLTYHPSFLARKGITENLTERMISNDFFQHVCQTVVRAKEFAEEVK